MDGREYKLNIDPRILELLGPSLYTNIYYILAELVANAYDADAKNVYIIVNSDDITVEDDGTGMSYSNGDIAKYLNVAAISRTTETEAQTALGRRKMGRKGVGKLAALSVSENVLIKTIYDNEKSGFILSRYIGTGNLLEPIPEDGIHFEKVKEHGTAVVMLKPQYQLHQDMNAIKRNLIKIFPLVNVDFKIHIIRGKEVEVIDNFDQRIISELSTLIILGEDFDQLSEYFQTEYRHRIDSLLKKRPLLSLPVFMKNRNGEERSYNVEIEGWIGTYRTTRGRKSEMTDFPDNFISLYSNKKMGEFNILPIVGQNKLGEVYVVGQIHVDIFELTELPDMALSNRQGYKSDDRRFQVVIEHVRDKLLPEILKMREIVVELSKADKTQRKLKQQKEKEKEFRDLVDKFRDDTSTEVANKISESLGDAATDKQDEIKKIIDEEINKNAPSMGIKSVIDSQKKKILISQTYKDKDLADVIYNMLVFNGVPGEDIIYTNCDDEVSRIPEGDTSKSGIYDYLRTFFVDSYSTQKIYIIFVTSHSSKVSWGALIEVGAAWVVQNEHKIFNITDFRPEHPLDDDAQWHTSSREGEDLCMTKLSADIFAQKIEYICDKLGYAKKGRPANLGKLATLVKINPR